jgi:hypothetical protein
MALNISPIGTGRDDGKPIPVTVETIWNLRATR